MSITVKLDELAETLERFGVGYLLTTTDDGQSRVLSAYVRVVDGALVVPDAGRGARANATARPAVTLLFPPADPAEHSLIVDGVASLLEHDIAISPTWAVLHRPAPPASSQEALE